MQFDPAMAARQALAKVQEASNELGGDLEAVLAAEKIFSGSAGKEASEAYRELVAIGARHPGAGAFGEFLVYITWSHLMDETQPEHFQRGLALCQNLLRLDSGGDSERLDRRRSMEESFRAGLGKESEDVMDYKADTPQGGD